MKKKFMFLVLLILCTGCGAKYTLTIDENKIHENIEFDIDESELIDQELAPDLDLKSKESIEALKQNDFYAIKNDRNTAYTKKVKTEGNITHFDFKYDYPVEDFNKGQVMNSCFTNSSVTVTDKEIQIHFSGEFRCLDSESDYVDFSIITKNKIKEANFDYGTFDTEFTWRFDSSNSSNIDIQATLLRESTMHYYGRQIAPILLVAVVLLVLAFLAYHLFSSNRRNKI